MHQASEGREWDEIFRRKLKRGEFMHLTPGKDGKPLVINADDHGELLVSIRKPRSTLTGVSE